MLPIKNFSIKNEQVKEVYEFFVSIFYDQTIEEEGRIQAFQMIGLIQNLVSIYEENLQIEKEDWIQVKMDYQAAEERPVFPEEKKRF